MRTRGVQIAVATLSGLAIASTLAGCGASDGVTNHAHHHGAGALSSPTSPSATPSTPTASPTATSSPKTVAKPPAPAPVHHVAAPPKPPVKPPVKHAPPPVSYKDGSYSSLGTYISPGGHETLKVTLTLSNQIITALDVTSVMVDPTAAGYEADFEAGVNAVVVGRNIASIHVGAVGGSSLTSLGFNSALANIKAQAKN